MPTVLSRGALGRALLVWGIWTLWGLFMANQLFMIYAAMGRPVPDWRTTLLIAVPNAWYWALATPLIVWLTRRLAVRDLKTLALAVPVHVVAVLLLGAGEVAFEYRLYAAAGDAVTVPFLVSFIRQVHTNLLFYVAIAGVAGLIRSQRIARERQTQTARLETELVRAQLDLLRMQIQPHFLFNTLNAISQLFHEDPDAAERMMARLGDMLRLTLEDAGAQEVTLAQELEFLDRYIDLQRVRFQNRLDFSVDAPTELLDAQVPNLLLQPLVENAIQHGVMCGEQIGRVRVQARATNHSLLLEVWDNGPGPPPVVTKRIGLRNTEMRIRRLYGDAARFELRPADPGTRVTVQIPMRRREPSEDTS